MSIVRTVFNSHCNDPLPRRLRLSGPAGLIALLVGVFVAQPALLNAAGAPNADLVQASLLADVSSVAPGQSFAVGVLLKIKPGWHVYWSNPGDAGIPTRVKWILPSGYTASDLRFPVPLHIDQPGGLVIYGYTDEVLLTATITPPPKGAALESAAIPIAAKVNWLCCEEDCVLGKATLSLDLVAGDKSAPANPQLFEQWQTRLPTIAPAPAPPLVLSDPTPHATVRSLRKITDPKAIIPGAVDGLILTVGDPKPSAFGTSIPISAQVLKGQTVTAKSVPILLTWADPDGKARLGEQINVPIMSGR